MVTAIPGRPYRAASQPVIAFSLPAKVWVVASVSSKSFKSVSFVNRTKPAAMKTAIQRSTRNSGAAATAASQESKGGNGEIEGELAVYTHSRTVTVCNDGATADAWVGAEVGGAEGVVGLDCEWAPPWFRGSDAPERVDVLQLATDRAALVLSLTKLVEFPPRLSALLADPAWRKVGVNVGGDCQRLSRDFGIPVTGDHNLAVAANRCSEKRVAQARSLADMAEAVLHVSAGDKKGGPRMSNWSQWPLTETQSEYAAADAAMSYDIYVRGPAELREELHTEEVSEVIGGQLKPSNAQNKRKGGESEVTVTKKAAHNDFFIMMRNKSIEPPKRGKKEYPDGDASALEGFCFVVSGVLDSMSREDCYAYIRKHGGEVSKSVTGRVTHILNDHGEVGPAKKRKAADRNIPIVGEDTLLALVDPSRAPSQ